jgi:hypothetical protein
MTSCTSCAAEYDGVPIAAFEDPTDANHVICWADGRVAKSPPPVVGGSPLRAYDRVVFVARRDGTFLRLVQAGYRDSLPVQAPSG